jgi:hypothetical protein
MIRDFIYIENNFFNKEECDILIDIFKPLTKNTANDGGYNGFFFESNSEYCNDTRLKFINNKFQKALDMYLLIYPEPTFMKSLVLKEYRFKHWKPGKSFENWHQEVGIESPFRVLNFMIYLSSHNCGTQFFDNKIIKSEKGKLVIFPCYFTHLHRGQKCPENKDRYIFGGYVNMVSQNLDATQKL